MRLKEEFAEARRRFDLLSFYEKFEQIVILILTVLIAVFVIFAVWNVALKVLQSIASNTAITLRALDEKRKQLLRRNSHARAQSASGARPL